MLLYWSKIYLEYGIIYKLYICDGQTLSKDDT